MLVRCECCEHLVESYADENLDICQDCLEALEAAEDDFKLDNLGYPKDYDPELIYAR